VQPKPPSRDRKVSIDHGIGIDINKFKNAPMNQNFDDKNGDGISGKANFVYSPISKKYELGRYTHKASVAKLKEQVAFAASNDIGLTTTIEPNKKCTSFQKECLEASKAKEIIDFPDERLEAITYYLVIPEKLDKVLYLGTL